MTRRLMPRRDFLGAAGLAASTLLILPSRAAARTVTPDAVFRDPDQPVLGNPAGDVTIAEFFDYQCPFCKKDYPIVERFLKSDGNVRLVMKDWPVFGPPSVRASHLVLGASTLGQYKPALHALMSTRGRLTDPEISQLLEEAGINVGRAETAYQKEKARWNGLLSRTAAQADALGLRGTPAFVIGNQIYSGMMDAEALTKAVARARSHA